MAAFTSTNGFYVVTCPNEMTRQVRDYVDKVESFLPLLREVFGLEPSYERLTVLLGERGPCYAQGGTVYLQSTMDVEKPQEIYGGLFHETVHGFLESYIRRKTSENHFPEACAIILQVAALDRINSEWASRYAGGFGCNPKEHALLFELVRIYKEYGFGPIRAVYSTMIESDVPVLHRECFLSDLNNILVKHGVTRKVAL